MPITITALFGWFCMNLENDRFDSLHPLHELAKVCE
jgi:hypothetical protein